MPKESEYCKLRRFPKYYFRIFTKEGKQKKGVKYSVLPSEPMRRNLHSFALFGASTLFSVAHSARSASSTPTHRPAIRIRAAAPNDEANNLSENHPFEGKSIDDQSISFSSEKSENSTPDLDTPASASQARLTAIGHHLYGKDFQTMMHDYVAHCESGGARDQRIEYELKRREQLAFRLTAEPLLYRFWILVGLLGSISVYYNYPRGKQNETVSQAQSVEKQVESVVASSCGRVEDALMRYLGTLSVASTLALTSVHMPLVSLIMMLDYCHIMWGRYGSRWWNKNSASAPSASVFIGGVDIASKRTSVDDSSKMKQEMLAEKPANEVGYNENGKNRNLHEAVVTKAFYMWFAAALTTNFILVFIRGHLSRVSVLPPTRRF